MTDGQADRLTRNGKPVLNAITRAYQLIGLGRRNQGPQRRLIKGNNGVKGEI